MKKAAVVLMFLASRLLLPGQDKDMSVEVEKFFLQSFSDDKKPEWRLHGDKSRQLSSYELDLEHLRLTLFSGSAITFLQTPHCLFDRKKKIGGSRSVVSVKSKQTSMTGKGYDFNLQSNTIFIRSDVKVIWSLNSKGKSDK